MKGKAFLQAEIIAKKRGKYSVLESSLKPDSQLQ
jgi:hypothetical protein